MDCREPRDVSREGEDRKSKRSLRQDRTCTVLIRESQVANDTRCDSSDCAEENRPCRVLVRRMVYERALAGDLPSYKLPGGKRRFLYSELLEAAKRFREGGSADVRRLRGG